MKHRYDGSKRDYLIYKMTHMSDDALIIKLCDRLQNISDAFTASEKFRNNYFNETSAIVEAIESDRNLTDIHKRILDDIKAKLDNISSIFKIKRFGQMNYIKTYELFSFGKKSKTWQEKFEEVYKFYLDNKNKEMLPHLLPHADVNDDSFSIAQGSKHIVVYGNTTGRHKMEVVDFEENDIYDAKSSKGVYPISQEEYDKYLIKCQEISDWLDDISEKEKGKSHSTIGEEGFELDFDEGDLALDELNDKLKSQLPIGQELEFELSYHAWLSESKNTLIVERRKLKINDVKIGFGGNRFYAQVFTIDPFNQKAAMWIESDTSSEYHDLESLRWPYRDVELIRMSYIKPEMSRKEERESTKNRKYPWSFSYDITPSKYESIEFIKNITELLSQLNDQIKNRDK